MPKQQRQQRPEERKQRQARPHRRFAESSAAAAAAAAAARGTLDPRHSLAFAFPMATVVAAPADEQHLVDHHHQQQQEQPQLQQKRNWKTEIEDFVANSSIRGLKRTIFSPNRTLRCFWSAFVLGSCVFAFSQVAFLVEKYLLRETIVHQHKAYGHLEEFPAVSFCVSDPFSDSAEQLWRSGAVQSPNDFSRQLRNTSIQLNSEGKVALARSLLRLDQREAYFQNIPDRSLLRRLGHLVPFYFCAINPFDYGHSVFQYYNSSSCNISVHSFLHPINLNCYTLFFNSTEFSKGLKSIFLVLPAGRSEPRYGLGPYENASFLRDTLKKYTTVQVVLHEASKKPNFDETMMLTNHPSVINVISFTTSKFVNNDCVQVTAPPTQDNSNARHMFNQDDFDACLGKYIEDEVIRDCGCTQQLDASERSVSSSDGATPLCFRVHWDNLSLTESRLKCSLYGGRFLESFIAGAKHCPRPCQSIVYETNLIQSSNAASEWQRCWYMGAYMDTKIRLQERQEQMTRFLTTNPGSFNFSTCRRPWYSELPYVMLKVVRQDFTTRTYNETLVLTSTALFAQVGAALAFYLGLTLTFAAEIPDLLLRLLGLAWNSCGRRRRLRLRQRLKEQSLRPINHQQQQHHRQQQQRPRLRLAPQPLCHPHHQSTCDDCLRLANLPCSDGLRADDAADSRPADCDDEEDDIRGSAEAADGELCFANSRLAGIEEEAAQPPPTSPPPPPPPSASPLPLSCQRQSVEMRSIGTLTNREGYV